MLLYCYKKICYQQNTLTQSNRYFAYIGKNTLFVWSKFCDLTDIFQYKSILSFLHLQNLIFILAVLPSNSSSWYPWQTWQWSNNCEQCSSLMTNTVMVFLYFLYIGFVLVSLVLVFGFKLSGKQLIYSDWTVLRSKNSSQGVPISELGMLTKQEFQVRMNKSSERFSKVSTLNTAF